MILSLIIAATLAQSVTAERRPGCPELLTGQTISVAVSAKRPACVFVTTASGEATQIAANHNKDDIALHLSGEGKNLASDGFEFGTETLTINSPGHYRVDVRTVGTPSEDTHLTVSISRIALTLQSADSWKSAEASATDSKRSRKIADISASLVLWQTIGHDSSIARTWLKLGDALLRSGDFAKARDAYERALEMCHSQIDTRCTAEAANNSGMAARQLGDFTTSFTRLEEAAEGWRQLPSLVNQGRTLSNLGILFTRVGDFQQAISAYDRAENILRGRDPLAYARVLNNLGLCYLSLEQHDKAEIYFGQAIAVESGLSGAEADLVRARLNLGRTLMLKGRLLPARALLERTLAQAESQPDRGGRAFVLNNLGQTLWRLGQLDAAEGRLKEALDLHHALGDKRGEAIAVHYLGVLARKRGDVATARELLNKALQIRRECGLRDEAADSLYELASMEFAAGNSELARDLAREAIPLLESVRSNVPGASLRASFYARRRNLLDLLVAIAMRPDNPNAIVDGFVAAELGRGRALLDLVAERRLSSPQPVELVERRTRILHEVDLLSLRAATESKERESLKRRIQSLIAEDEGIEARIRESIEVSEPVVRPLTSVSALQRDFVPSDSAILEYELGEQRSYLWVVRNKQIAVFELPTRTAIERQVAGVVDLFSKILERQRDPGKEAAFKRAMRRLSATLLGCLNGIDLPPRVILVLDGDLHRVPFSALRLPNGQYLGIIHDLLRVPSAAYLMHSTGPRPLSEFPKSIVAFSDPVFSSDDPRVPVMWRKTRSAETAHLARLPFNEELETISRLVPPLRRRVLRGFDANADALRTLRLDEYGILHLSTHAVINDQIPELSRIVLSVINGRGQRVNGFVLPHQLAQLHLRGSVVVLSACDTALGKKVMGEGLIGFATSLFSAGAAQLVLTLTEVDAQASSVLLSEAYRKVFGGGHVSVEHALTLTRRSFLKSKRWSDPYYWASFIVVGAPTVTNERENWSQK